MTDIGTWTAIGAIAQTLAAVATFAAVLVSLRLARQAREPDIEFWIGLERDFADESQENFVFHAANVGKVPTEIIAIGWEAGLLSMAPLRGVRFESRPSDISD